MPTKLKDLIINRVDLVERGDNPEASIALFKRKQEPASPGTNNDGGDAKPRHGEIVISHPEFADKGALEKFAGLVRGLLQKEGVNTDMPFNMEKFTKGLTDDTLKQRLEGLEKEQVDALTAAVEALAEEDRTPQAVKYELDLLEKEAELQATKDALEQAAKPKKQEDEEEDEEDEEYANTAKGIPEEIMKTLPEDVRKVLEENQTKTKEALDLAKRLQTEKLEAEYVGKARNFSCVVAEPEKVGKVLKKIADFSKEDYDVIEAVLKAANERINRNDLLLKEIGANSDAGGAGDAWGRIVQAGKEIVAKNADMTLEQAIDKVIHDEPTLYEEYRKEQEQGVQ